MEAYELITKCPQCLRVPAVWLEQAVHNSRELVWVGCEPCGHLLGALTRGVALQNWDRFVARWKFEHAGIAA